MSHQSYAATHTSRIYKFLSSTCMCIQYTSQHPKTIATCENEPFYFVHQILKVSFKNMFVCSWFFCMSFNLPVLVRLINLLYEINLSSWITMTMFMRLVYFRSRVYLFFINLRTTLQFVPILENISWTVLPTITSAAAGKDNKFCCKYTGFKRHDKALFDMILFQ